MLPDHQAVVINDTDSDGRSALHIACELRKKALVLMLLHYGAGPYLCDNQGTSPLYVAVSEGHDMVVELMLTLGKIALGRLFPNTL